MAAGCDSPRANVVKELHLDSSCGSVADGDVEEDDRSSIGTGSRDLGSTHG